MLAGIMNTPEKKYQQSKHLPNITFILLRKNVQHTKHLPFMNVCYRTVKVLFSKKSGM